jgi:hypothetical protein
MNNIKNIHFFGCSFTALEFSETGYEYKNYRKLIEEKLLCNCTNHSFQGKSNEEIINDVYLVSKKIKDETNTLFVIQTTFLNRLGMYCDIGHNDFISMCKMKNPDDGIEKIIIEFYNHWLKYFYRKDFQLLEFEKLIDLLCSWLSNKGIKFILIGMDESLDLIKNLQFFEKNNFLQFENYKSFYSYSILNQMRIHDIIGEIENTPNDYHFNQKGHDILVEQIIKKINELTS